MLIIEIITIVAFTKLTVGQEIQIQIPEVSHKTDLIIGGVDARISDFPFMASLQIRHQHFCGATILSPQWLLTAAHCVENPKVKMSNIIHAVAGVSDCMDKGFNRQIRVVESRHVHGGFWQTILTNDIALLKVVRPFQFNANVRPVTLATRESNHHRELSKVHEECIVVGWGMNGNFVRSTLCPLRMTVIALLSLDDCRRVVLRLGVVYQIPRTMICTWYPLNLRGVFVGDSGGPLLCGTPGKFLQQGIISHGLKNYRGPKFFTRIDKFEKWISRTSSADISAMAKMLVFFLIVLIL